MPGSEQAPQVSTEQEKFDSIVGNAQKTAELAQLANATTSTESLDNSSLIYDDRETGNSVAAVDMGNRYPDSRERGSARTTLLYGEGNPTLLTSHTGRVTEREWKDYDKLGYKIPKHAGRPGDAIGLREPGLSRIADSSLPSPETGRPASSRLEVSGYRRINGEHTRVRKELLSDTPFVARLIAEIALKDIRQEATSRINRKRLENDDRWTAMAKEYNRTRKLGDKLRGRDKASKEDVMLTEADADDTRFNETREIEEELKAA